MGSRKCWLGSPESRVALAWFQRMEASELYPAVYLSTMLMWFPSILCRERGLLLQ